MSIQTQLANFEKIRDGIAEAESKIATVDSGLRPEVREERINAVRKDALAKLADVIADVDKRANAARDGLEFWSQDAARRRAKFDKDPLADATIRTACFATLGRASTPELLGYLDDAIREGSVAKAETVRLEFARRTDASREIGERFRERFVSVVDHEARAMHDELQRINGVADFSRVVLDEFETGRKNPAGRINAARAAGMIPPATTADPTERVHAIRSYK